MSLVAMNTKIPPYEIWGGHPAKKIGELPKPEGKITEPEEERLRV